MSVSEGTEKGQSAPTSRSANTDEGAENSGVEKRAQLRRGPELSQATSRAYESISQRNIKSIQRVVDSAALHQFRESAKLAARVAIELPRLQVPRFEFPQIPTESFQGLARLASDLQQQHRRQFAGISTFLQRLNEQYKELFQGVFEQFEQMAPELARGVAMMAMCGWYLDKEMPIDVILDVAYMGDEDLEQIDRHFGEHFRNREWSIEAEISGVYPDRRALLQAAFGAHRNGLYELSIPVFLAQADGIFSDGLGGSPFIRHQREKARRDFVEAARSMWVREVLPSAMVAQAAVWMSEQDRDDSFSNLNRHQVLHGEVVDYGTEVNSLKAVSLLNYCVILTGTFSTSDQNRVASED